MLSRAKVAHGWILVGAVLALQWMAGQIAWSQKPKPISVFILAGQSNMQGHAKIRTFEHLGLDPTTAPLLAEMQNPDGTPVVCERVWISCIGCADQEQTGRLTAGFGAAADEPKIGPEFTFGLTIQKYVDGPILLIKTAWGGKSLNTDFRPPSAGPYVFHESQLAAWKDQGKDIAAIRADKIEATGKSYQQMIEHIRFVLADIGRVVPDYNSDQGYELAGFVWFQGWNDMVDSDTYPQRDQPGGYDAYSEVMAHFIRDVRTDLQAPQLPFVIGVLGVGGPVKDYGPDERRYQATHQNFRDAMAAPARLPEFEGNVTAVLTEKYWDRELTELRAKEHKIEQEVKQLVSQGKLPAADEQETIKRLKSERLTAHEQHVLSVGISNQEYHYLGSAKILGRIGQAFAQAMADLKRLTKVHE